VHAHGQHLSSGRADPNPAEGVLRETTLEEEMEKLLARFVREEEGQDLVEYAFLIVFIALVVAVGLNTFGINLRQFYVNLSTAVGPAVPAPPTPGT
jgi:Flp pilus assembly pilin Flp